MKEIKRLLWAMVSGLLAVLALVGISSIAFANYNTQYYDYPLQQWDMNELDATISSILSISSPNTAIIPFLTDFHIPVSESNSYLENCKPRLNKQLAIYDRIAQWCEFDLTVFGGDYLENNSETAYPAAYNSLSFLGEMLRQTDNSSPRFVLKGNHDDNTMFKDYSNGFISNKDFYDAIGKLDMRKTVRDAGHADQFYGYYDIPNKKIRVFCLNTCDVPSTLDKETNSLNYRGQWDTGFSQSQLQFVADHLYFDEAGWYVLFFSHHPLHNEILEFPAVETSFACGVNPNHGGASMLKIITAFTNGQVGSAICTTKDFESEVSYDFTHNKSNTVVAMISGHTHLNSVIQVNGITAITANAVDGHDTYRSEYGTTSSSNYFIIDRDSHKLHWISCDIYDETGNAPVGEDRVLEFTVAEPGSDTVRCTGLSLKNSTMNVDLASTEEIVLQAMVSPINCNQPIEWTSSDNSIVQVDATGSVQVIAMGTAVITARCGGQESSVTINVVDFSDPIIDGWSIRGGYAINASADTYTKYSQGTRGYARYGDSKDARIPVEGGAVYRVSVAPISNIFPEWKSVALNIVFFQGENRLSTEGWKFFDEVSGTYEFTTPQNADAFTFNVLINGDNETQAEVKKYAGWLDSNIHIEKTGKNNEQA